MARTPLVEEAERRTIAYNIGQCILDNSIE